MAKRFYRRKNVSRNVKRKKYNGRKSVILKSKLRVTRPYLYKRWLAYGQSTVGLLPGGSLVFNASQQGVFTLSNVAGATSYATFSLRFLLSDLPNFNDFTALYDKYKICMVKVKVIPFTTSALTGAAYSSVYGQSSVILHSIIDTDDAVIPMASVAGVSSFREYQTYKVRNMLDTNGVGMSRVVKPKVLQAVTDSSGLFQGTRIGSGWINLGNTNVDHYGMKFILEGISGGSVDPVLGQVFFFKVEAKYYLAMKEVR